MKRPEKGLFREVLLAYQASREFLEIDASMNPVSADDALVKLRQLGEAL